MRGRHRCSKDSAVEPIVVCLHWQTVTGPSMRLLCNIHPGAAHRLQWLFHSQQVVSRRGKRKGLGWEKRMRIVWKPEMRQATWPPSQAAFLCGIYRNCLGPQAGQWKECIDKGEVFREESAVALLLAARLQGWPRGCGPRQ